MPRAEPGSAAAARARRVRLPRRPALDWIAAGLLAGGLAFVASGLLPHPDAGMTIRRIAPLLLFLGTVIPLAELTAAARVFDVIAVRLAGLARGSYPLLFAACVLFAATTTAVLNLDTTAVLLTPVMLALARRTGIAAIPLAMTTVWLANTASLLLPVSNLTNLLAAGRVALPTAAFAARMWPSELASVAVTMVFLWMFFWRRGARGDGAASYDPPAPQRPDDPVLFWTAGLACLLFIVLIAATPITLGYASAAAAAIVVAAFAARRREALKPGLVPWRLLVFVVGLFLVVQTISLHGLDTVTRALIGSGDGAAGALRAAAAGAGLSNAVNNLPAYVAGEAVISHHVQLLALLIGTNVGPVITPWASLATLLWYERCRSYDAEVPLRTFMLAGAGLAACALAAATGALLLSQ